MPLTKALSDPSRHGRSWSLRNPEAGRLTDDQSKTSGGDNENALSCPCRVGKRLCGFLRLRKRRFHFHLRTAAKYAGEAPCERPGWYHKSRAGRLDKRPEISKVAPKQRERGISDAIVSGYRRFYSAG